MKKFKLEFEMKEHTCKLCPHKEFHYDKCRLMLMDSGCYRPITDSTVHPDWCPLTESHTPISLYAKVKTPDGIGTVVEMCCWRVNGLYFDTNCSDIVVWYGTGTGSSNGWVQKRYDLKEVIGLN